ncbi:hypothetical protein K501DRAFT_43941 [Backusella circina FSU 941]|nr:hypothetical protein K501DRAFT_43941 [Backusella circina FSU 941]
MKKKITLLKVLQQEHFVVQKTYPRHSLQQVWEKYYVLEESGYVYRQEKHYVWERRYVYHWGKHYVYQRENGFESHYNRVCYHDEVRECSRVFDDYDEVKGCESNYVHDEVIWIESNYVLCERSDDVESSYGYAICNDRDCDGDGFYFNEKKKKLV